MKRERGITLVALVVTVIILIILTVIGVRTISENRLMELATGSIDSYKKAEVEERFFTPQATLGAEAGQEGRNPTIDEYIKKLEDEGIIDPDKTTENEDGSKEVVTPDGWVAELIPDGSGNLKDVIVKGEEDSLETKILTLKLDPTTSSIKADITVKRGEGTTYTYYYKEGTINEGGEYIPAIKGTSSLTYTIEKLKQDTNYTIKVEATNKNGTSTKYATARTGAIGDAEGVIELGQVKWNNGVASVEVIQNSNEKYKMKYDVYNEKNEIISTRKDIDVNVGGTIGELYLGYTVRVRLTDGTNYSGNSASVTVQDTTPPVDFIPTITEQSLTTFKINATGAKDNESGIESYKYYVEGEVVKEGTTDTSFVVTGKIPITTYKVYVEAIDKAGNVTKSTEVDATTTGVLNPPTITVTETPTNGWYKEATITITDSVTNGTTAANKIRYEITGAEGKTKEDTTAGVTTVTYKITKDGKSTVNAWAVTSGNKESTVATLTISRDATPPAAFTPTIKDIKQTTFTIDASSAKDALSQIESYNYYINSKAVKTNSTANTYGVTGQEAGRTYKVYVEAIDKAGNLRKSTVVDTTTIGTAPTVKVSATKDYDTSKKVHSLTITATGTDPEGGTLTYKLTYGTVNGQYTIDGGSTSGEAGKPVKFTITDLAMATPYYYKVEGRDSTNLVGTAATGSIKTYCIGEYCNGSGSTRVDCDACEATGKVLRYPRCVYCYGTGERTYDNGWTVKCNMCAGLGFDPFRRERVL